MKATTPERKGGIRGWVLLAAIGIGASAVALIVALVMRADDVGEAVADDDAFDDEDGDTDVFDFSGGAPLDRSGRPSAGAAPASDGELRRLPERFRGRIQLAALGPRPPLITPEQLVATLQQNRAPLRECVRQAGGFRAMRASAAAGGGTPDGGQRVRPSMRFDVGADGRVVHGSVSLEPAGPEGLSSCVADALRTVQFPPAGGDGAHVELPLGLGRGGRRRPDGGIGGARDGREERGGRRPGGEDRAAGSATVPAVAPP